MKLHSLFYASILVVSSFVMVQARTQSNNKVAETNKEDVSPSLVAEDAEYWDRILQQDMSVQVPLDRCADITCENPIEGCDPFDGICKPIDAVVPCIAIIDESSVSNATIEALWTNFRQVYPDRPFCLLQPLNSASSTLYIPPSFLSDPRTTFAQVSRDDAGAASEIQPSPSDWFNICGFAVYQGSDIDFIGKFLDTSGSMTLATVFASNDLFDQTVSNAGLTNRDVFNTREDWITPFVTTLVPGA
jgi:hypothetical protein